MELAKTKHTPTHINTANRLYITWTMPWYGHMAIYIVAIDIDINIAIHVLQSSHAINNSTISISTIPTGSIAIAIPCKYSIPVPRYAKYATGTRVRTGMLYNWR